MNCQNTKWLQCNTHLTNHQWKRLSWCCRGNSTRVINKSTLIMKRSLHSIMPPIVRRSKSSKEILKLYLLPHCLRRPGRIMRGYWIRKYCLGNKWQLYRAAPLISRSNWHPRWIDSRLPSRKSALFRKRTNPTLNLCHLHLHTISMLSTKD